MRRSALLSAMVGLALLATPAQAPAATPPPLPPGSVSPAIPAILDAFKTHPLVGLGDAHGMAQELDFYAAVIRDPRFAAEVGNLVVEFGGAARQSIIDSYVAGEPVPYAELRKVWTDTVGWIPLPAAIGFMNVFAQVRATNMALPPDQRIRVWLGEPPIDWSQINNRDDLTTLVAQRDSHPADLIRREILGRNKKALVIYGGGHFLRGRNALRAAATPRPGGEAALRSMFTGLAEGAPPYDLMSPAFAQLNRSRAAGLRDTVAAFGPLKTMTFRGVDLTGMDVYDIAFANQHIRAAILLNAEGKIEGSNFRPFDAAMRPLLVEDVESQRPGAFFIALPYTGYQDAACSERFEAAVGAAPALVRAPALLQDLKAAGCGEDGLLALGDAVLFVGPRAELTASPTTPDLYLDEDYRREISRRLQIMTGQPLPAIQVQPVTPWKYRPYPQTAASPSGAPAH